jgi:trigger factor
LKAIRERVLPVIDAEFLKRFGVESEAALREKIRNDLVETAKKEDANHLKDEVAKFLLENTDFDLPQSVVAQETGLMIRSILERITARGATEKQIGEQRDEILQVATRSSTEKVKMSYILSRIADEEKIGVNDDEVKAHIEAMSQRYNMTPERLTADLEKANGMERLKSDIRSEKTLDFLVENAKIKT